MPEITSEACTCRGTNAVADRPEAPVCAVRLDDGREVLVKSADVEVCGG